MDEKDLEMSCEVNDSGENSCEKLDFCDLDNVSGGSGGHLVARYAVRRGDQVPTPRPTLKYGVPAKVVSPNNKTIVLPTIPVSNKPVNLENNESKK